MAGGELKAWECDNRQTRTSIDKVIWEYMVAVDSSIKELAMVLLASILVSAKLG